MSAFTRSTLGARCERPFQTLHETKWWIGSATAVFLTGCIVGFVCPGILLDFLRRARGGLDGHKRGSWWSESSSTFMHNCILDYLAMRLGVAGGLLPGAHALLNGMVTGTVFARVVAPDRLQAVALILPHAIFELPALFIATGLGLWLGLRRRPRDEKKSAVKRANEVFLLVVMPLALLAAMLEETPFTTWQPRHVQSNP